MPSFIHSFIQQRMNKDCMLHPRRTQGLLRWVKYGFVPTRVGTKDGKGVSAPRNRRCSKNIINSIQEALAAKEVAVAIITHRCHMQHFSAKKVEVYRGRMTHLQGYRAHSTRWGPPHHSLPD